DVASERTEGRVIRQRSGIVDVACHQQAHGGRLDIALDTGDLAREKSLRIAFRLKGVAQMLRTVDEGVAMHRPETREDAVLEAGNHLNDALLFGNLHLGLEADDVEKFVREIFFAELYDCIWPVAGGRFFEPHRLHRTETERV